jgi:broad specificity phosphatase PhoE
MVPIGKPTNGGSVRPLVDGEQGHLRFSPSPVEQVEQRAEMCFERSNLTAQTRLRLIERSGGLREGLQFGNLEEVPYLAVEVLHAGVRST